METFWVRITGALKSGIIYDCVPKGEYGKLQTENKRLRNALVYAHCQLININATRKSTGKFEVNLEMIEQALTNGA